MKTILLFALTVAAAGAQIIDVPNLFQPTPLSGMWKHHAGDDPRWADPAFDDSAWPGVRMPEGAVEPGDGFSWYRFRVRLPEAMPSAPLAPPLAVMIGGFSYSQAYEVFWNGKRAGGVGDPDGGPWGLLLPRPKAFDITGYSVAGYKTDAVIAIRLHSVTYSYVYRLDPAHRTSWIGARQPIRLAVEAWEGERLRNRQPLLLVAASIMMPGFFFLVLPLWRRDEPEYFWFGLWLLLITIVRVQNVSPETFGLRTGLASSWTNVLPNALFTGAWVGAMSKLFRSRISLAVWIAAAAAIILNASPVFFVTAGGSLARSFSTIVSIPNMACVSFIYYELGWRTSRSRESVPAIHAAILTYLASNFAVYGIQAVRPSEASDVQSAFVRIVILLLFTFAMAILMNQRSARLLGERQRLGREMESAAEVQALLLTSLPAPGDSYRIEPVYLPASEVGGDFYQILERADGSRLVLVGDVSGKGLKAAMLVAVVVGAVGSAAGSTKSRSPAALLARVNQALMGRTGGGFVTACCARFDPDGTVTIANAGHPSPYCDGRELEVEGGLPLGIAPGVEYAESVVRGERFTFVSDGVVEAENAQRELFGFERTLAASTQSAQAIAEAARAWGQNDDITVVTVRSNG